MVRTVLMEQMELTAPKERTEQMALTEQKGSRAWKEWGVGNNPVCPKYRDVLPKLRVGRGPAVQSGCRVPGGWVKWMVPTIRRVRQPLADRQKMRTFPVL